MEAKAQDMAMGSILFGVGVVTQIGGLIYGNMSLLPVAYLLMGAGFALFARGALAAWIKRAGLLLTGAALAGIVTSGVLLVTRRDVEVGLVMGLACLAALLTLAGTGLYRAVSTRTESRA